MNPLYLETFRRNRVLFALPVVLAVVGATWATVAEPKTYRSSVSLWSDLPGASGQEPIGVAPLAEQEQSMLTELLTTKYFRTNIARGGPLAEHLRRHPTEGWGPATLLAKLRGSGTLDEQIEVALSLKRVTSTVQGPHVLKIDYDATSPTVAAGTLRSLVGEFRKERGLLRRDALTSYRDQVVAASAALVEARTRLRTYIRDHPGSTDSPEVAALARAERDVVERLAEATERFGEVSTTALDPASFQRTLRVIDPPEVPAAPRSGPKRVVLAILAGVFAGALVSIVGIVAVTKVGRTRTPRQEPFVREDVGPGQEGRVAVLDDAPVVAEAFAEGRTRSE